MKNEFVYIYGKHAVLAALQLRPEVIASLHVRTDLLASLPKESLKLVGHVVPFEGSAVPKLVSKDAVHQGYIANINVTKLTIPFSTFVTSIQSNPDTILVVLGEVQDPHNAGAVIRSAAAFGATAVLIPEHRQVGITGTVLKVSAGTAFSIDLVRIPNVNQVLSKLKGKGFFVYGLDANGQTFIQDEDFRKPSVLVLGNEGTGLRVKTHEACDIVLSIPMHPRVESLNAAVSAGVVLQSWAQRHPKALEP